MTGTDLERPRTDWESVLAYLGLDPRSPETKALVLLCDRYRLDPLLGHASIIATKGAFRPYITRDGMLEVAHRSGQLDGIVVDEMRRNTTNDGWTAYVSVWRKDMAHPFKYGAQCKDTELAAKNGNGPEMALARAERRSLKRAFAIPTADSDDVHPVDVVEVEPDVVEELSVPAADGHDHDPAAVGTGPEALELELTQSEAHAVIGSLPYAQQLEFLARHRTADFDADWPQAALHEAAELATEPF